jgi:8-oxo-dGTP diphosphatase
LVTLTGTHASLSVDNVIFGYAPGVLSVLAVRSGEGLAEGRWGLPGDWPRLDESLEDCAARVLRARTGLEGMDLRQLHTFSAVDRYPGHRVVTTAFWTLVREDRQVVTPGARELDARWFPVREVPALIFDHDEILATGLAALRDELRHRPVGLGLLDETFTFLHLQQLYEAILDTTFDKPNFRRKLLAFDYLEPVGETLREGKHRRAQLFRFEPEAYHALEERGFSFTL